MSAVFEEIDGKREYQHIQCDAPDCNVISPPAAEIMAGHGLINMGWHCSGGIHYCPRHAELGASRA